MTTRRCGAAHSECETALNEDAANNGGTDHAIVRIRIARVRPSWVDVIGLLVGVVTSSSIEANDGSRVCRSVG